MKATRLQSFGDIDQFRHEEVADPVPGAGEVLIRIAASGFNPVELYIREGYLAQMFATPLPAILGVDAAGTVESVGPGVDGFKPGDRVVGMLPINGKGSNAELVVAPADILVAIPQNLDLVAAAALPASGLTGYQAVKDYLKPKAGDRVLVSGALGGVGRAAILALKQFGAVPVATVRPGQEAAAAALGVESFVIGTTPSAKFDGAVDSKGGDIATSLFALVKDGGTIAAVAGLSENAPKHGPVTAVNVFGTSRAADLKVLVDAAARGEFGIPIGTRLSLAQIGEGHRLYASGKAGGKIVFVP